MDLQSLIQGTLSDDLLKPEYRRRSPRNRFAGHCYAASEAYYHLAGGKPAGLKAVRLRHEGDMHWWVEKEDPDDDGVSWVIDITEGQFEQPVPYEEGIGCAFLTRQPSKRAQEIIRRVRCLKRLVSRIECEGFPEPDFVAHAFLCGDSFSRAGWSLPGGIDIWTIPPIAGLPGMERGSADLFIDLRVMGKSIKFRAECGFSLAKRIVCDSKKRMPEPRL